MKGKIWILVLVLSLAMNIGVATMFGLRLVQAKKAATPQECPFSPNDTHLYTLLSLTPEQQTAITPLARDFHEHIGNLSGEIHQKRNLMIAMMEQDPVDMDQVNLLRKEMQSLQFTLQQQVFEHILKMKQMLKPEQRNVFFQALRQSFIPQVAHANQ
jgi:Spy/CpxP family protein refolding chaperone